MSDPDYRVQARAVRAAARQRIRELSLQRGAGVPRWQAAASTPAAPAAAAPSPAAALPPAPVAALVPQAAQAAVATDAPVSKSPDMAAPESPPVAPAPAALVTDVEADAEADGHDLSVMTVSLTATALAHRSFGASIAPEPVARPESDLSRLPGVGPGLVWLLSQAGVPDCQTLVHTDASALAARLGIVGQLIEIGGLQALAARAAEAPNPPGASA